jgi:CBS domain-containing protein
MSRTVTRIFPDDSLYSAWLRMSRLGFRQLAVVRPGDPTRLVGLVTAETIGQVLRPPKRGEMEGQGAAAVEEPEAELNTEGGADKEEASALPAGRTEHADPLTRLHVSDAMLRTPGMLEDSVPLAAVEERLRTNRSVLVINGRGELVGLIMQTDLRHHIDLQNAEAGTEKPLTAGLMAVRNLVTAQPNETLRTAIRRMSRAGIRQLPVVDESLPARPVGLLRRSGILAAYERALEEQTAEGTHQAAAVKR